VQDEADLQVGMTALKIGSVIPRDIINDIECLICNESFAKRAVQSLLPPSLLSRLLRQDEEVHHLSAGDPEEDRL